MMPWSQIMFYVYHPGFKKGFIYLNIYFTVFCHVEFQSESNSFNHTKMYLSHLNQSKPFDSGFLGIIYPVCSGSRIINTTVLNRKCTVFLLHMISLMF